MANVCGKKASDLAEELKNQDGENHCNKKVTKATFSNTSRRKKMKLPKSNIVALNLAKCFSVNKGDVKINSFKNFSKECETEEIVGNSSCEFSPLKSEHSENGYLRKNKVSSRLPTKKSRLVLKKIAAMKKKKISSMSKRFIKEFVYFSKRGSADPSNGKTISYQRTLWWLKKAAVIDNRRITINDVEIHFINKLKSRQELTILEFIGFLKSLCDDRGAKMSSVVKKLVEYRSSQNAAKQNINRTQHRNLRLTEPKSLNPTNDFFKSTRKGKISKGKKVPSSLKGEKSNARLQISENECCTSYEVSVPVSLKNVLFEETTMLAKESFEEGNWDSIKRLDGILPTTLDNILKFSSPTVPVLKVRKSRSSFSLDSPKLINGDESKTQTSKSTGNVSGQASDRNAKHGDGNDYHKSNISSVKPKKNVLEKNESSSRMLTTDVKKNGKNCPLKEHLNNEPMNTLLKSNEVNTEESPLENVQVLHETIQTALENTQPQDTERVNKGMDENMSQSKKLLSQQIRLECVAHIFRDGDFLCERKLKSASSYNDKRSNEEIHAKSALIKNETTEKNSSLLSIAKSNSLQCIKPKMEKVISREEIPEKVFKKELQYSEFPGQYEEDGKKGKVAHVLKNEFKGTKNDFVNNIKEDHFLEADIKKKLQVVSESDYKEKSNGNDNNLDDSRCISKANCSRSEFSIANKSLKIKENKASNVVETRRRVIKTFTNLPIRTVQKAFAMSKKVKNKKLKLGKVTAEEKCKKLRTTKTILPTAAKTIKQSLIADDLTSQQNEMDKKGNTKVLTTKPRQLSNLQSSERSKPSHFVRNKENFKRDSKTKYKPRCPKQKNPFRERGTSNYYESFKTIDIRKLAVMLQENQLALKKPFLGAEKCKTDWKFIEIMAKIIENDHNVKNSKFHSETLKGSESEVINKKANKPMTRSKTTSTTENDGDTNQVKFCFDVVQKNQLQLYQKTSFITRNDICNENTDCTNIENITADLSNLSIVREVHLKSETSNRDVRIHDEHIIKTPESDCKTKDMKACFDALQENQVGLKRKAKNSKRFHKKANKNVRKKSTNTGTANLTDKNLSTLEAICKKASELNKMSKSSDCQIKTTQNRNPLRKICLRSTKINTQIVNCQKCKRKVNILNTETNFKDLSSHVLSKTNKKDQKIASNTSCHIQSMIQLSFIAEQNTHSQSTEDTLDEKLKMGAVYDVEGEMITSNNCEEDFQEIEKMGAAQYGCGHEEVICNECTKGDVEQREGITTVNTKKICKKNRRKVAKTFTNLPVRKVEKALAKIKKEKTKKLTNVESRKNTSQNKSIIDKSKANCRASKNFSHPVTRIIAKNKSMFTNSIQESNAPDNQIEIPAHEAKSKSVNPILNSDLSENVKHTNPKKKKLNKAGKNKKVKRKHLQDPETLLQSTLAV